MSETYREHGSPVSMPVQLPGSGIPSVRPMPPLMAAPFESNFAIFGVLFAIWVLIDQSFFSQWMGAPPSLFTAPLAALLIWRRNSVKLFVALMCASLWSFCWKTPFHVNNVFIGAFFASLILISTCIYLAKHKALPQSLRELERGCFPTMRVGVIAVFYFAVLHKTNSAFLDPRISCAVIHTTRLLQICSNGLHMVGLGSLAGYLPSITNPHIATGSIYMTWCSEAAIPTLLLLGWLRWPSRKLITIAIVIALGFHYVMSFNGYQNFSMLALAYYVPFLPVSFYRTLSAGMLRLKRGSAAGTVRVMVFLGSAALSIYAIELLLFAIIKFIRPGIRLRGEVFIRTEGWMLFNWAIAPVITLGFVWYSFHRRGRANQMAGTKVPAWTYALLAVMVLNSMSPYLGLKTENSFAMFSNLLTEGNIKHWNHSFLPPSMRVFHYQDHLVSVTKTNLDSHSKIGRLTDGKYQIVEFEFRREMAIACRTIDHPISVDYEIEGKAYHVQDAHQVPELSTGNGYLLEKLMFFRLVPNSPYGICLH